jgi:RND family efflux transporter MFP subunit
VTDLHQDLAGLKIERGPTTSRRRGWAGWVVAIVLVCATGAVAWAWLAKPKPVDVQTAVVSERAAGTQASVLNASGYVTARRRATVSSKITGKVIYVNVEEGRAVKQGDVLARLDDSTLRAALNLATAQAEAARRAVAETEVHLAKAKLTLDRVTKLRHDGLATPSDVDAATEDVNGTTARIAALKQQIEVAERQIDVQKADLDNTVIRAPFSGIAISKDAQPGEMVSPVSAGGGFTRTGICTIVDMHSLEIEVDVNESYINRVTAGQRVTAVLDAYPDWQIPAHVIAVVPTADRQKATVLVRIGFEQLDPRILPDMGVKVTFLRNESDEGTTAAAQPATLAPASAIRTAGSDRFAFVVTGDTVERRAVRVGGADGDRVEVIAGLHPGDRVVVAPSPDLREGVKVAVK